MSMLCPCAAAASWALITRAESPAWARALLIRVAISLRYDELLVKLQLAGPVGRASGVPLIGVRAGVKTGAGVATPIKILTQNVLSVPIGSVSPVAFFNS